MPLWLFNTLGNRYRKGNGCAQGCTAGQWKRWVQLAVKPFGRGNVSGVGSCAPPIFLPGFIFFCREWVQNVCAVVYFQTFKPEHNQRVSLTLRLNCSPMIFTFSKVSVAFANMFIRSWDFIWLFTYFSEKRFKDSLRLN